MIPQNVLASENVPCSFLTPRDVVPPVLTAYDYGGVAISDASKGLLVQVWRMRYIKPDFVFDAPSVAPTSVFTRDDVVDFDATFDQSMRPFLCYTIKDGTAFYRFYDALTADYSVVTMAPGVATPRCQLDDKRPETSPSYSDIILAYIRSGQLMMRIQRDRFGVEYPLDAYGSKVRRVGMGTNLRFLFDVGG